MFHVLTSHLRPVFERAGDLGIFASPRAYKKKVSARPHIPSYFPHISQYFPRIPSDSGRRKVPGLPAGGSVSQTCTRTEFLG